MNTCAEVWKAKRKRNAKRLQVNPSSRYFGKEYSEKKLVFLD